MTWKQLRIFFSVHMLFRNFGWKDCFAFLVNYYYCCFSTVCFFGASFFGADKTNIKPLPTQQDSEYHGV